MVALADLHPASFRGAAFRVPRDNASEGRNSITHEYPDSSRRYVEDNGYIPPEFTLTCILHGANLLSKFNTLRSALNRPGPGTLHHPWYGAQTCAVKGPWKVKREDADSGVLELEVCFLVTGSAVFPAQTSGIAAQVTALSSAFVSATLDTFATAFGNPFLSVASLEVVSAAITDVASVFNQELGAVTAVYLTSNHLLDDPERYAANGSDLSGQLSGMFRGSFEDLATTYSGEDITSALTKVDAALSRTIITADAVPTANARATIDYVARASALYTFSTFCRLTTISCMAEAMAGTIYKTADDVAAAEKLLLSIYESIPTDGVPVDTAQALADIVGIAMGVLRDEELQLPRIATLAIYEYPLSVLAYQLYESDDRTQMLVDLNLDQNPVLADREASVLTGVDTPN